MRLHLGSNHRPEKNWLCPGIVGQLLAATEPFWLSESPCSCRPEEVGFDRIHKAFAPHGAGERNADDRNRTYTGVSPQAPEACASASSATSAKSIILWPRHEHPSSPLPEKSFDSQSSIFRPLPRAYPRCAGRAFGGCDQISRGCAPSVILSASEESGPSATTSVGCVRGPDASRRSA